MSNLLEKYRPRTLKEYGNPLHAQICLNYIKSYKTRPMAKAVLLYGPAGTGKTTLVQCLSREFDWPMVEVNTSLDASKDVLNSIENSVRSKSLMGDRKVFFFDEADNLNERQQKRLLKIIDAANDPVFLAANNISKINEQLKKKCLTILVQPPSQADLTVFAERVSRGEVTCASPILGFVSACKSFRDVISALESGSADNLLHKEDDPTDRIKSLLTGKDTFLNPGEYWMPEVWILDNSQGQEASNYNLWRMRYEEVGRSMEKYLLRACKQQLKSVEFPWSLGIKVEQQKVEKAPVPKVEKVVKQAEQVIRKSVTKSLEDWF